MTKTDETIQLIKRHSSNHYDQFPVVMEKGEGIWLTDVDGNRYLDCVASYSALPFGHCPPEIIDAITLQINKLHLCGGFVHHSGVDEVLTRICYLSQLDRAFLMNSGAEAVEAAIKLARKWGYTRKQIPLNQAEILVAEGNFHGRTSTIVSFSSTPQYKALFGPPMPGFKSIPFGDAGALKAAINPNTAAFLVEPCQGEGGIVFPPEGYLKAIREICDEHNILLIFDEIQSGFGRTGYMFAHQAEDALPDLMTLGKALSGGFSPVSAVVGKDEIIQVFEPGDHGSTFATNPLACAAATASMKLLVDKDLVKRSFELGQRLKDKLSKIQSPFIKEVRGRGLFIGVALSDTAPPPKVLCYEMMKGGLFINETKGALRVTPPLIISEAEIEMIYERMRAVFERLESESQGKKKVAEVG